MLERTNKKNKQNKQKKKQMRLSWHCQTTLKRQKIKLSKEAFFRTPPCGECKANRIASYAIGKMRTNWFYIFFVSNNSDPVLNYEKFLPLKFTAEDFKTKQLNDHAESHFLVSH